jgi:ribonuclease HII
LFLEPLVLDGVDDSKKVPPKVRERLFEELTNSPRVVWGIGVVDSKTIDEVNIYQATLLAMKEAVERLSVKPDTLLVDGMNLEVKGISAVKIIKGDELSYTIGAASILAKVTRDRMMRKLADLYPLYGFGTNMGYGTEEHRKALEVHGPCEIHRRSFEPVKSRCMA